MSNPPSAFTSSPQRSSSLIDFAACIQPCKHLRLHRTTTYSPADIPRSKHPKAHQLAAWVTAAFHSSTPHPNPPLSIHEHCRHLLIISRTSASPFDTSDHLKKVVARSKTSRAPLPSSLVNFVAITKFHLQDPSDWSEKENSTSRIHIQLPVFNPLPIQSVQQLQIRLAFIQHKPIPRFKTDQIQFEFS